jgi:hypothetical protein
VPTSRPAEEESRAGFLGKRANGNCCKVHNYVDLELELRTLKLRYVWGKNAEATTVGAAEKIPDRSGCSLALLDYLIHKFRKGQGLRPHSFCKLVAKLGTARNGASRPRPRTPKPCPRTKLASRLRLRFGVRQSSAAFLHLCCRRPPMCHALLDFEVWSFPGVWCLVFVAQSLFVTAADARNDYVGPQTIRTGSGTSAR